MTKHTPGPWAYEKTHETIWVWGSGKQKIVMHVSNEDELKSGVRAENEANAKLIAAAPELKGELETLRNALVSLANDPKTPKAVSGKIYLLLNGESEAIKKATI